MNEIERVKTLLAELEAKQAQREAAASGSFAIAILSQDSNSDIGNRPVIHLLDIGESWGKIDLQDTSRVVAISCFSQPIPKTAVSLFKNGRKRFADRLDFDEYLEMTLSQAAFDRGVSIVSSRDRTGNELLSRLTNEGYSPDHARLAVERLIRFGLLNDARYAETFIRTKLRAGWGRSKIERELQSRGVDAQLADGYPDRFFDSESDYDRAVAALKKKVVPSSKPVEKFTRFLIGRGFSFDVSYRAAKAILQVEGTDI